MVFSLNKILFSSFVSLYFFWILFSGNAIIFDVLPVFLFNTFFILLASFFCKNTGLFVDFRLVIFSIFLAIIFFCLNIWSEENRVVYYFWPLYMFISILSLMIIDKLSQKSFFDLRLFIVFFVLVSTFLMIGASQHKIDGRGAFIFGPNVLYRIFAISSLLFLLLGVKKSSFRKIIIIITSISMFLVGVVVTSSRGSLILIPILLLASLHLYFDKVGCKVLGYLGLIFLLALLLIMFFVGTVDFDSRLLLFNLDDNIRYVPWVFLFEEPLQVIGRFDFSYIYFYSNFAVFPGFQYPHNILLEFFYYYELIGVFFIFFLFLMFFKSFASSLKLKFNFQVVVFYVATILLVGGMFSGDLTDNFSCIALMLYLSSRKSIKNNIIGNFK